MLRVVAGIGWLIVVVGTVSAAEPEDRWEAAIQAFEKQDREMPPLVGGNLFIGSSSVRMWKLAESFPEHRCLNRGFGGSQLADVAKYGKRILAVHRPAVIVVYAGDNDLAQKRTPEQVRDDFRSFIAIVREQLPETKVVWIAIKPSRKRWALREQGQRTNALVREEIAAGRGDVAVDIWGPMLGEDGLPRTELYLDDELHLTPAGYAIWNKLVAPHLAK